MKTDWVERLKYIGVEEGLSMALAVACADGNAVHASGLLCDKASLYKEFDGKMLGGWNAPSGPMDALGAAVWLGRESMVDFILERAEAQDKIYPGLSGADERQRWEESLRRAYEVERDKYSRCPQELQCSVVAAKLSGAKKRFALKDHEANAAQAFVAAMRDNDLEAGKAALEQMEDKGSALARARDTGRSTQRSTQSWRQEGWSGKGREETLIALATRLSMVQWIELLAKTGTSTPDELADALLAAIESHEPGAGSAVAGVVEAGADPCAPRYLSGRLKLPGAEKLLDALGAAACGGWFENTKVLAAMVEERRAGGDDVAAKSLMDAVRMARETVADGGPAAAESCAKAIMEISKASFPDFSLRDIREQGQSKGKPLGAFEELLLAELRGLREEMSSLRGQVESLSRKVEQRGSNGSQSISAKNRQGRGGPEKTAAAGVGPKLAAKRGAAGQDAAGFGGAGGPSLAGKASRA